MEKSLDGPIASVLRPNARWLWAVEKILPPVMFVQHFIVVFHFHYFSNKCREFVYLFYEMLRANFNLMISMTCCFLLFFFFLFFFFSVLKPEKAAQATSADLKQVVMGNAGCALCTSRAPCADLMDTATLPRRELSLTSHTHTHSTSFSSSHLSQSLRLSLCCHWIVEEESEPSEQHTSGRRAVQWCNWWCKHLKLFTFLSFFILTDEI